MQLEIYFSDAWVLKRQQGILLYGYNRMRALIRCFLVMTAGHYSLVVNGHTS